MTALSTAFKEALEPTLLAFADDELMIGHRHSEWTGWAPAIEEDIAFSSIAQDEIGHARLFYELVSDFSARTVDELALGRKPDEYSNAVLCERHNGDWAYTLARHFVYEIAERLWLEDLQKSSFQPVADVSVKLLREERYHQLHADAWLKRVASGPIEGRRALSAALAKVVPDGIGLFEATETEAQAIELGIFPRPGVEVMDIWFEEVGGRLDELDLSFESPTDEELVPTSTGAMIAKPGSGKTLFKQDGQWVSIAEGGSLGGRHGRHTEEFETLWDDLTKTYREEPTATW